MNKYWIYLIVFVCFSCKQGERKENIIAYLKLENDILEISTLVDSLNVPWDIEAVEKEAIWFTELEGKVYRYDLKKQEKQLMLDIPDVLAKKSYGLLGMCVDPESKQLFVHYTFSIPRKGMEELISSRLVKYDIATNGTRNPMILLDSLPGATFHNGSRLAIGPDRKLYFSLGDVGRTDLTQDPDFLGGKILRLNLDGSIPPDNPIENNPIWAMGLRNTQGMVFGKEGLLYASDHGPLNDDEVNLIVKGGNYGWPAVQGFAESEKEKAYAKQHNTLDPLIAWTPTIATAGTAYVGEGKIPDWKNSLLQASMKGRSLRVLHLDESGTKIREEGIYLQKVFGRIRDIAVDANGTVFFSTSNHDWHPRFQPWLYDSLPEIPDRIISMRLLPRGSKLNDKLPVYKRETNPMELLDENWSYDVPSDLAEGARLYTQYCLTCHGPEGKGAEGLIPPLAGTSWVTGDKGRLIRVTLFGISEEIEVEGIKYQQEMPAFEHLDDEELAEILTFIRNSFGNQSSAVIAGEILEERKSAN